MLPGSDGLSVCQTLRAKNNVPIIMLTAKSEEIDKVLGLELGANDYITKPFSMRELIARIKVQLRNSNSREMDFSKDKSAILESGNLMIDTYSYTAKLNNEELNLRPREFNLLTFFLQNKGKITKMKNNTVWVMLNFDTSELPTCTDLFIFCSKEKINIRI